MLYIFSWNYSGSKKNTIVLLCVYGKMNHAGHATDAADTVIASKNMYGQVWTPPQLVQELLDKLPHRVWTDPTLRWIDPCAGEGIFLEHVLARLMVSLAHPIPHSGTRKRHILTKMLYMMELNPVNVQRLRGRFGANANLRAGNFLTEHGQGVAQMGGMFDIIVANPPYQTPKFAPYVGSAGNRTLWDKFLWKSLTLLADGGFLVFVTPPLWRRPEHPLYPELTQKRRLVYLHILDKQAGLAQFGVQSRFDLYVIENKTPKVSLANPCIVDAEGVSHRDLNVAAEAWPFLPNGAYDLIHPLLDPLGTQPVIYAAGLYDARTLSRRRTKTHRYPVVHTLTRHGLGLLYTDRRDSAHFGMPKVILNVNEKQYPINDYKGEYGMSQLSFGLPIQSRAEGERLIRVIMSPEFQEILGATKWTAFQTDHRMFRYLKLPR